MDTRPLPLDLDARELYRIGQMLVGTTTELREAIETFCSLQLPSNFDAQRDLSRETKCALGLTSLPIREKLFVFQCPGCGYWCYPPVGADGERCEDCNNQDNEG